MADDDFSVLSSLKLQYPSVPTTVLLKVINKYGNDRGKCKQALDVLDVERNNCPSEEEESGAINFACGGNSSFNNNAGSPSEINLLNSRLRELQVKHNSPAGNPGERHVSTIQRAVGGNNSQTADSKKPHVAQSVSWTVQKTERQSSSSSGASNQYIPPSSTTPQTAPADFTPFVFASTVNDIPQIGCNAHTGRVQQASSASTSSSNSPAEQRRPVKVINIPPGSLSGGSVSIAATPPNSRHIRMHFGDTGGECTVSGPPSNLHRNQPAQTANPHFITELHTEATMPQPVHSSSIFVNTNNPNPPPVQAKSVQGSGYAGEVRRAINPPMTLNTSTSDNQKLVHNGVFSSHELLSFPVQASSPGIANSKPMFVEIKRDTLQMQDDLQNSSNQHFYTSTIGRSMPPTSSFPSHPMMYNPITGAHGYVTQYNQDFTSPSIYTASQSADQFPPQQQYGGYPGHHMNLYQSPMNSAVSQNMYPHYVYNYAGAAMGVSAQMPQFGYSPHDQAGQSTALSMLSSSRSNSQESEHSSGAEFDPRLMFNPSHVSSHSSPSSDKSYPSLGISADQHHPRTGSVQDEIDERDGYVAALLQHQKNRLQKMREENVKYNEILNGLRKEVSGMEKSLTGSSRINSFPSAEDIAKLCENNRSLQTDIQMYMNELEMYKQGQVPINELNPLAQQNFFENMPTGQQDPIYSKTPGSQRTGPPPRPPPPIPVRQPSVEPPTTRPSGVARHFSNNSDIYRVPPVPPPQPTVNSGESDEGGWNCKACTFLNFPALKECEMCGLLRDPPLSVSSSSAFSSTSSALSQCPPALPPHHPLTTLPPRLTHGLVGGQRYRSNSPADMFSRQHHHDHTGS